MCAFEGKATTHSQFLASDKFRVALRERTYLGHRQIIEICVVRCVAPFSVLTVGTSVGALTRPNELTISVRHTDYRNPQMAIGQSCMGGLTPRAEGQSF
jgi:hypothetical protein